VVRQQSSIGLVAQPENGQEMKALITFAIFIRFKASTAKIKSPKSLNEFNLCVIVTS
jgi:hypothetical protein